MIPRLNISKINNRGGAAVFASAGGGMPHSAQSSHAHGQHGGFLPYTASNMTVGAAEPSTAHTTTEETGRTPALTTPRGSATPATAHASYPTSRVAILDGAGAPPSSAHTFTEGALRSARIELPPSAVPHGKSGIDEAGAAHTTAALQGGGASTARSARAVSIAVNSASFARRALELTPLLGLNVQLCQDVSQLQLKLLEVADRLERTESYYERQLQERSQYFQHRLSSLIAFLAQAAEEPGAEPAQASSTGFTPAGREKTRRSHRRAVQVPVARGAAHVSAAGHTTTTTTTTSPGSSNAAVEGAGAGSSYAHYNYYSTSALSLDLAAIHHQPHAHPQRHPPSPAITAASPAMAAVPRLGLHGTAALATGGGNNNNNNGGNSNGMTAGTAPLSRTSASPTGVVHPFAIPSPATTPSVAASNAPASAATPIAAAAPQRANASGDVAHAVEAGDAAAAKTRTATPTTTAAPSHETSEAVGVAIGEGEGGAEGRATRPQVGGTNSGGGGGSLLARVQRRNRQRREYAEGYGVHLTSPPTSHASHNPSPSAS